MDHDIDVLRDLLGAHVSNELVRICLIILTLLLTWVLRWLITKMMPYFVRFLAHSTHSTLDEKLVVVLHPPVRFLIGTLGLWLCFVFLGLPGKFLGRLIGSLVAIAIFWALYRAVDLIVIVLHRILIYSKISEATLLDGKVMVLIQQLTKGFIVVFSFVVIMGRWDYNVGGLMAGLGLGGLAVALAAQDALANLIGYFMIVADEPFLIGEYVVVDNNIAGIVEGIGFRSTRIRVLDQSLVVVPNKMIESGAITNWSRLVKRRLNMTLGLSYHSSPEQVLLVIQGIREMLKGHQLVYTDSVIVQLTELADTSLNLSIICFMKTPAWDDFQAARQDINLKILTIMAQHNVENANPSFDIVVEQKPSPMERVAMQDLLSPPQPESSLSLASDSPVPDDAAN